MSLYEEENLNAGTQRGWPDEDRGKHWRHVPAIQGTPRIVRTRRVKKKFSTISFKGNMGFLIH